MIKKLNPTTPSRRHTVIVKTEGLSTDKLPRHLLKMLKYSAGRSGGTISMRHKGGRVKRYYRMIDFKRDKFGIEAEVVSINYDPNRSANIALVQYSDGERRLILATKNMVIGQKVVSGLEVPIKEGNATVLSKVPSGTFIHNVEVVKGRGGVLGRSAGVALQKQGDVKGFVQIKMPSGEIRLLDGNNFCTIGEIGNEQHNNRQIGKAGTKRKMGIRPTVRGVVMSWKHPHAGGQGKSGRVGTGGPPKTPWGKRQGLKTRKQKRTNKYIMKRKTSKTRPNVVSYKTIV